VPRRRGARDRPRVRGSSYAGQLTGDRGSSAGSLTAARVDGTPEIARPWRRPCALHPYETFHVRRRHPIWGAPTLRGGCWWLLSRMRPLDEQWLARLCGAVRRPSGGVRVPAIATGREGTARGSESEQDIRSRADQSPVGVFERAGAFRAVSAQAPVPRRAAGLRGPGEWAGTVFERC